MKKKTLAPEDLERREILLSAVEQSINARKTLYEKKVLTVEGFAHSWCRPAHSEGISSDIRAWMDQDKLQRIIS